MKAFWIGGFGLLGVFARYAIGLSTSRYFSPPFPYGTFLINILGSFAIGVIYVLGSERELLSPELRMGLMVGFLGGFTTFSSYTLETARLLAGSEILQGLLYFALSPLLGLGAALLGIFLARLATGGLPL